jgi:hypothetical protein
MYRFNLRWILNLGFLCCGLLMLLCSAIENLVGIKKAPVIEQMVLSRYEIDPGDTLLASVTVQDESGDVLHYEWSANGGQFIHPVDRPQVNWIAPAIGGVFTISIEVSNSEKSSTDSENVTVRSFVSPSIKILSPEKGAFLVQYDSLRVRGLAQHNNGINRVNLYVNDVLHAWTPGHQTNEYVFTTGLSIGAGPAEVKLEAIANVTFSIGRDSVMVTIEGVVPKQ